MKYKVIKDREQYDKYCLILESLIDQEKISESMGDEIDLLTTLIEVYDKENNTFDEFDPIELLHSLMAGRNMKPIDLANYLETSRGHISDILNYKRGISKEIIQKLAVLFKMSQEAFNRTYPLIKVNSTTNTRAFARQGINRFR